MVRDKANGSETPKFQLLTGRPVSFALIEMRSHARHRTNATTVIMFMF